MSEYTPKTWEIKHAYVDTTEYVQRMEKDSNRSLTEINEEFDRWLAEHEAKVREDYKGRVIDALENAKHNLDTSDPFTDGFLTALDEIAKIIESTKKRATDSFGYL